MLKSTLPAATALGMSRTVVSTYRISVKPSARRSSSTVNCGAVHSAGVLVKVTLVVSGAPSLASARGLPSSPAADAEGSQNARVDPRDKGSQPQRQAAVPQTRKEGACRRFDQVAG